MKKLSRIENLLFLIPIAAIFPFGYELWQAYYGQTKYELYAFGRGGSIGWYLVAMMVVPFFQTVMAILPFYLLHYFLRAIDRRNKAVCYIHVIGTVVYWVLIPIFSATSVVPGWHTTVYYSPMFAGDPFTPGFWTTMLFWALQLAFIIHGVLAVRRWRKSAA